MDEQCAPSTPVLTTVKSSTLQVAQKENFPPKNATKLSKVSFQTPARDPVTRRVLSPQVTNVLVRKAGKNEESVCSTEYPESLLDDKGCRNKDSGGSSEVSSLVSEEQLKKEINQSAADDLGPDNKEQVSSCGTCTLDLDMLDMINPFQTNSKIVSSPVQKLGDSELDSKEQSLKITLDNWMVSEKMSLTSPYNINADHSMATSAEVLSQLESQSNNIEHDSKVTISQTLSSFEVDCPEKIDLCASQMKDISQLLENPSHIDFGSMGSDLQMGEKKLKTSPIHDQDLLSENTQEADADSLQPLKLEIEFNDEGQKPPSKKLEKGPEGQSRLDSSDATEKIIFNKSEEQNKEVGKLNETDSDGPSKLEEQSTKAEKRSESDPEGPLVPKSNYIVDWDKLDDPNFNPFGGVSKIDNSSSCVKLPAATLQEEEENVEPTATKMDELQKQESSPGTSFCSGITKKFQNQSVKKNTCKVKPMMEVSAIPLFQDSQVFDVGDVIESRTVSSFERRISDRIQSMRSEETGPDVNDEFVSETSDFIDRIIEGEAEEFRPADQIPAFNQPIEVDYLEQFGHSLFHASALRKQSLYLKFDPLLKESPMKVLVNLLDTNSDLEVPTTKSIMDLEAGSVLPNYEMVDVASLIPDVQSIPNDPMAVFASTVPTEGAIVEVLKYSQKDMDAAMRTVKQEADTAMRAIKQELGVQEGITLKWKQKHEESLAQSAEMKKIVDEYAKIGFQMMETYDKKIEEAKAELEKVTKEKQQVLKEMDSIETSFSELFKRFEKQKEVLEGYKKNEESLKKCAQDYLARIKKEEQRYQALKAHAEEKLNLANEEIAQVRNKYKAEIAATQAHLRKEQMKVNSLERSLADKTKENFELSKICDELILKMEKI
ncbi:transforming acidic coiled-coil-containing protein 3 isoform X2 [Narcine bancroftii]|uniref:transforming acidic coiled-coil-containing protein 3 isoform X2 n=1 Tax=Narcine bancroftii TaxID=1343680 RepID=UPI00383187A5